MSKSTNLPLVLQFYDYFLSYESVRYVKVCHLLSLSVIFGERSSPHTRPRSLSHLRLQQRRRDKITLKGGSGRALTTRSFEITIRPVHEITRTAGAASTSAHLPTPLPAGHATPRVPHPGPTPTTLQPVYLRLSTARPGVVMPRTLALTPAPNSSTAIATVRTTTIQPRTLAPPRPSSPFGGFQRRLPSLLGVQQLSRLSSATPYAPHPSLMPLPGLFPTPEPATPSANPRRTTIATQVTPNVVHEDDNGDNSMAVPMTVAVKERRAPTTPPPTVVAAVRSTDALSTPDLRCDEPGWDNTAPTADDHDHAFDDDGGFDAAWDNLDDHDQQLSSSPVRDADGFALPMSVSHPERLQLTAGRSRPRVARVPGPKHVMLRKLHGNRFSLAPFGLTEQREVSKKKGEEVTVRRSTRPKMPTTTWWIEKSSMAERPDGYERVTSRTVPVPNAVGSGTGHVGGQASAAWPAPSPWVARMKVRPVKRRKKRAQKEKGAKAPQGPQRRTADLDLSESEPEEEKAMVAAEVTNIAEAHITSTAVVTPERAMVFSALETLGLGSVGPVSHAEEEKEEEEEEPAYVSYW